MAGRRVRNFAGAVLALLAGAAVAEPYLAVREGLACAACHVDPSGAGLRTPFGNAFSQLDLPALPAADATWTGQLMQRFAVGGNARSAVRQSEFDDRDDALDFGVDRVTVYGAAALTDRVSLYLDQQIAPGGSLNRQAWARIDFGRGTWLRAGRMYLPYGWRLEDDTAFVRQAPGINLTQGDDGVEVGVTRGTLTWQLAVVNGNGGAPDSDDGKQFVTRAALVRDVWQGGFSAQRNDTDGGDRTAFGAFLGLRTGPVAWLAEYDRVEDQPPEDPEQKQDVALLEANLTLARGHNLKLTAEGLWFDDGEATRYRYSAVYEYFPWAFTELRLGIRLRDSDDGSAAEDNSEEGFLQLHLFF